MRKILKNEFLKHIEEHKKCHGPPVDLEPLRYSASYGKELRIWDAEISPLAIKGENLSCCSIVRCKFRSSNLQNVDFSDSDLYYTDFNGSVLCNAKLNGCDLKGSDFTNANLSWADLDNTDLTNVKFCNTVLWKTGVAHTSLPTGEKVIVSKSHICFGHSRIPRETFSSGDFDPYRWCPDNPEILTITIQKTIELAEVNV